MSRQFRSDDSSKWNEGFGSGADGAKTVSSSADYDGARTYFAGTSGQLSGTLGAASTFANGDLVFIGQSRGTGVGNWELNKVASGGGTTTLTFVYPLQATYTTSGGSVAQIVEMKAYSSLTVDSGITWSAPDWAGESGGMIACFVNGTATITGTASVTAKGLRGGAGTTQNQIPGFRGEGSSGASSQAQTANGSGAGGSSGTTGNSGGGGSGGHGAAGTAGDNGSDGLGGAAGEAVGVAGLTTLFFGGGGGSGSAKNEPGITGGAGGDGGGGMLIIAKDITVTGGIAANGGAGSAGNSGNDGGGGAGGAILLKGQNITLGSSLVTATGGAAGGSWATAGAVGRIHADYLTSITGTTSPAIDSRQDTSLVDPAGGAALFAAA